jgi:hypothetical protein
MKDPYQVLRQKEVDTARVRREIEALLLVVPLLADRENQSADATEVPLSHRNKWPLELEMRVRSVP